jgi:hypothetical protein
MEPEQKEEVSIIPSTYKPDPTTLQHESAFRGVAPEDKLNRLWSIAQKLNTAVFVPKEAQGDSGSVFYLLCMANDMGVAWTHALRSMYITPSKIVKGETVPGKIGIQGDLGLAALLNKGFVVTFPKETNNSEQGHCIITRPNNGTTHEETFTMKDAIVAELTGKDNWKHYPKTMMRWRAFMQAARFNAADVLGGCYLPEELEAIEARESAEEKADQKALNDPGLTLALKKSAAEIIAQAPASPTVATKKRGRPPKAVVNGAATTATVAAPPAPPAPVVSQATADVINAAPDPGPTPAPAPVEVAAPVQEEPSPEATKAAEKRAEVIEKFKELRVTVSKETLRNFYKGWFGDAERLPRDPGAYVEPLTLLLGEMQNFDHTMADKVSMDMTNYASLMRRVHENEANEAESQTAQMAADSDIGPEAAAPAE